ncbi:HET-like protein [Stemphylium lycopersici]|nr:HET-like protein [Stemphylium lycopersici]
MKLDSDKTFGELYPNFEALQNAVQDVEMKYCEMRSDSLIPLRFLTVLDPQPESSEDVIHLRLTRRSEHNPDDDACSYVAVSYTWEQPKGLEAILSVPKYKIWTSATESHSPYCPPSVLHRALQYDIQKTKTGRLWIDQECINQDNTVDRDEHVTNMHTIYKQSLCTVILLCQYLDSTEANLLTNFVTMGEQDKLGDFLDQNQDIVSQLHDVFKSLLKDPYFTRAWTYQEQRCSTDACYLVPLNSTATSQHRDDEGTVAEMLLSQMIIQACMNYLGRSANPDAVWFYFTIGGLGTTPTRPPRDTTRNDQHVTTIYTYGPEYETVRCIHTIERRHCKYASDRLAILANSSGMPRTLRTSELRDDPTASFSTCVLALLVMNGLCTGVFPGIMGQTLSRSWRLFPATFGPSSDEETQVVM